MMWISSVLLLVAFSGVMGHILIPHLYIKHISGEIEQCKRGIEELDFEKLQKESAEVKMYTVCPAILEAFHCMDGILAREFDSTLEEIADLSVGMFDEETNKVLRVAVNTKNMLTDLCTEGTQLNRDVKKDMQCFQSIEASHIIDAAGKCQRKVMIYNVFTDRSNEIKEAGYDFEKDKTCQETAFMAACVSQFVHEKCGQRAFNTFNTIIKRTTIFQNLICSKEKLEKMKTKVIDRFYMPKAEKNLFKLALDLKRRRK